MCQIKIVTAAAGRGVWARYRVADEEKAPPAGASGATKKALPAGTSGADQYMEKSQRLLFTRSWLTDGESTRMLRATGRASDARKH